MSETPPDAENGAEKPAAAPSGWMFAAGWALALLVLTLIFNGFLEERKNPNRLLSLQNQSGGRLELRANRNGQYFAEGLINGVRVNFLLDTGATTVAVPPQIASRAGLRGSGRVIVETAAGKTAAQTARIRRLALG
ncbi:MAG: retropepsin-like aspartic protease family protein, partial [Gammaproteobacteria bacterium]